MCKTEKEKDTAKLSPLQKIEKYHPKMVTVYV